jgi:Domain of unknown function (DUF5911)
VCASLLDADRGGHFRVGPDRDDYLSKQLYFPDTAALITRFMTPDGVGEVCDFMPVEPGAATDRHRLVRQLRVVRGTMRFVMDFQPRFGYARRPHKMESLPPPMYTQRWRSPPQPRSRRAVVTGPGLPVGVRFR